MLSVRLQKRLPHFLLDLQFEMNEQIFVLFGPSGSGKTTVLNCLAGLTHPDGGWIRLNGESFYEEGGKPLPPQRRKIGYLVQEYALFPHMTVERNIAYGIRRQHKESAWQQIEPLLQVLGIKHLLHCYPQQISGGEKQRVALARALATQPALLLLDEPLSALDQETREQCQQELLRIHDMWRIPFLVVTHDREEAEKLGQTILFMEKGTIQRVRQNEVKPADRAETEVK
ncbi:ATP-binding cassette domain-containing protein [Brevibacillus humidisoli]|uniref:ATP-binding cassette domain-containing protein n=1 Tax=Brevibacillus humidisoli TaxID=2895522 RepID=UPI001E545C07|nr:ATP-binding cassette domain-containing protein [Brevibacillus humidisoli]UFJ39595.1 ATP-binding cassette domain-containing protein [Brevibacillus humidisoli]